MCPAAQERQTREQILGSGRQVGPLSFGTSEDVSYKLRASDDTSSDNSHSHSYHFWVTS